MSQSYLLSIIALLCIFLLSGINIYLIINLIRGVKIEDKVIERLLGQSDFALAELVNLRRSIRRSGQAGESASSENSAALAKELDEFQEPSLRAISEGSRDAYNLLKELGELKDKELSSWKSANQSRIDQLLGSQALLQSRLLEAQDLVNSSSHTIRTLQAKNERLNGAEAKATGLEAANQKLEAEVAKVKNYLARTSAELNRTRQEAAHAKQELIMANAKLKTMHEQYTRDHAQLKSEKSALEMRLNSLQEAFNQSVLDSNPSDQLREAQRKFLEESEALLAEKNQLENQLNELQGNFERTLVEKAFIESVLLDLDSALNNAPEAAARRAEAAPEQVVEQL